jgi:RNA polymerase sporulation-specific sigma factor
MNRSLAEINIPKHRLLDDQETRELILRAQRGDQQARDLLAQHNLRLVMSIVSRFTGRGTEEEDLFQLGCLGLIKAIDRFDLGQGVQFSTYAVPLIMGEIRQFLRDSGPIKISRSIREMVQQVGVAREKLTQEFGHEPSLAELAGVTRLSREEIITAVEAAQPIKYLQETIDQNDQETITLGERVTEGGDPQELPWLEGIALKEVILMLEPRLKRILEMRFFEEKNQTQVAQVLGISQVQVSRLEKEALRRLRGIMQE